MATDQGQITATIDEARQHWERRRGTVRTLASILGVRQVDIADALGMSRQSFNGRMTGSKNFEPWELVGIAAQLGIPREVLDLEPDEAIIWLTENRREMLRNLCFLFGSLVAA